MDIRVYYLFHHSIICTCIHVIHYYIYRESLHNAYIIVLYYSIIHDTVVYRI